jgi:secretion/DNA translocation related TadE-like protein
MSRDRGSVSIWVISCAAVLLATSFVVVLRGQAVLARHRAEMGADLAALAAAARIGIDSGWCVAARRVAHANGASVLTCDVRLSPGGRSGFARVTVALSVRLAVVGTQTVVARAQAQRAPPR